MKFTKLLSATVAAAMAFSMAAIPAFAASSDTTQSTNVLLTAEASTFSVQVPTNIALNVAADGTVTGGTFDITNLSSGPVAIQSITVADGNWSVAGFDDVVSSGSYSVDDDVFGFAMLNSLSSSSTYAKTADSNGVIDLTTAEVYVLQKAGSTTYEGDSATFNYTAATTAVSAAETSTQAGSLVVVVAWYDGTNGTVA